MMFTSLSTSTGAAYRPANQPGMAKSSQPGMIGGLTGRPPSNSTGPGHADADAAHVGRGAADLLEQLGEAVRHPLQDLLRPERDVQVGRPARPAARPRRSLTGDPRVGRAEVGDQDHAGLVVERQHGGRAAAGRGAAARLVDEVLAQQRLDALGHGRAGEAGRPREVGARDRRRRRGSGPGGRRRWPGRTARDARFVPMDDKSTSVDWANVPGLLLLIIKLRVDSRTKSV